MVWNPERFLLKSRFRNHFLWRVWRERIRRSTHLISFHGIHFGPFQERRDWISSQHNANCWLETSTYQHFANEGGKEGGWWFSPCVYIFGFDGPNPQTPYCDCRSRCLFQSLDGLENDVKADVPWPRDCSRVFLLCVASALPIHYSGGIYSSRDS